MPSFLGKHVNITDVNFSNVSDIQQSLKNTGLCFVNNQIKINFNYNNYIEKLSSFKGYKEFYVGTEEHSLILPQILSSKLIESLSSKNVDIFVSSIVLRYSKNYTGSRLHRDLVTFVNEAFDYDIFTCWTPLTDVTLDAGPIAIIGRNENTLHKKECFIKKVNLQAFHSKDTNIDIKFKELFKSRDLEKYEDEIKSWDNQESFGNVFYAKNLNVGDVALFTKDVLHGSLDSTNNHLRVSLDFRLAVINKKYKSTIANLIKLNV